MSTSDDSAALAEIKELVGFVGHSNAQVRLEAAKMVTSLSALPSNCSLIAQTALIPAMGKQMTDAKEIAREIFKALINFGDHEELTQQMLKANFINISMECLRDNKTDLELRELILMFLVNMTRDEKGASVIMQLDEAVEGLHVRRLFSWFVEFAPAASGKNKLDPNAYCAHILTNISQIPAGRRLIMNRERGFLAAIKPQFRAAGVSATRRAGCFNLVKNCFMEESNHAYLLSAELGLWPLILSPIIGPEPFLHGEDEYKGILPEVRAQMHENARRDADPQLRVLVYEIILLCAKHKPSRVQLRGQAIYPILRHAHDAEKASNERELDELLEQLVPFFILDEDNAQHPDAIEAEKKRARVEQLKQLNAAEGESAPPKKPEPEPVDQPVHYLGDELGGDVRRREAQEKQQAAKQPVRASSSLPSEPLDENFPAIEPLGADETAQLGDLEHNIKTLEVVQAEDKKAAAPVAVKEVVYAQPEADDDEEEDLPPPLADEDEDDRHMNSLD